MKENTLKSRRKIAIYIDWSLRIPNFIGAYEIFKSTLFSDKEFEVNVDDKIKDLDPRFYWNEQMKNNEIEQFYFKIKLPKTDLEVKQGFIEYFYNEEHYKKFIDEYTFNLYVDTTSPNPQDIDVLNIAQELLFEVVLIDEYKSKRKKSNTLFFLSKLRIYPQSLIFLGEGQKLNEENYFAVWNPKINPLQFNKKNDNTFINWMKDLEIKQKELDNNG